MAWRSFSLGSLIQNRGAAIQVGGLLVAALVPYVLSLRPSELLASGDFFPSWLSPDNTFQRDLFLYESENGGRPSGWPIGLAFNLFWSGLLTLGLSASVVQALEVALPTGLSAVGTFLLCRALLPQRPLAPFAAGLFIAYNGLRLWNTATAVVWLGALLPWQLLLLRRVFRAAEAGSRGGVLANALAFGLCTSLAFSLQGMNLPQLIVGVAVLAGFGAVEMVLLWRATRSLRGALQAGGLLAAISGALSAWWLAAAANAYLLAGETPLATTIQVEEWSWSHVRNSFLNQFWLNPLWAWQPGDIRFAFWPYIDAYSHPFLQMLVFTPAFLGLSALLLARHGREHRLVLLLVGLLLGLLFLGKGLHEPFRGANLFLYQHIPGVWLLREPWSKLSIFMVLILALLIGLSLDALFQRLRAGRLRRWLAAPVAAGLLVLFPSIVFPLFVPELLYGSTAHLPSAYIRIPDYWWSAAAELRGEQGMARVLVLPGNDFYAVPYTWGAYMADGLPRRLLPLPVLARPGGYLLFNQSYAEIIEEVYRALEEPGADRSPLNALALLNTRYLLVRNDVADPAVLPLGSPVPDPRLPTIQRRLASLPGLTLERTIGELDLYRLQELYFLPRFYVPALVEPLPSSTLVERTAAVAPLGSVAFLPFEDEQSLLLRAGQPPPTLAFARVNPTKYRVQVRDATAPFLLVFSEGYHPGWRAYRSPARPVEAPPVASYLSGQIQEGAARTDFFDRQTPETWFRTPLPEERHLRVNGYANGWYLTEAGDYDLIIEYWPQRLFYWGLALGGLTLIGGAGFLLWSRRGLSARVTARPLSEADSDSVLRQAQDSASPDSGFAERRHRWLVVAGFLLLGLAVAALAFKDEPLGEALANWAYFAFVAAVMLAIWRLLPWSWAHSAWSLALRIVEARPRALGLVILALLALLLGAGAHTWAGWLVNLTATVLVLLALRRVWVAVQRR